MEGSSSFEYSDSFTTAGPRRKRKNRGIQPPASPAVLLQRTKEEFELDEDWLSECQQILRDSLEATSFGAPDVLCLGLGSPTTSRDARAQLAFLIRFCSDCNISPAKVSLYDPAFTDDDLGLFQALEMTCLSENKNGGYSVERPTILFMPHCDMELYENILRENWRYERLSQILLVANRLGDYIDNNPLSKLRSGFPCLLRVVSHLASRSLPTSSSHPTAFNNLSIQYLRKPMPSLQSDAFWELPP